MERLHFSHITSDELVVLNDEGVEYSIALDETLRSAIRRAPGSSKPEQNLPSPREIQEWVRDGKTIVEICDQSGAPEDYVAKFAQPVLDELNHIVESARAVRISLAGDRFSDITQIEFGNLISSRLASSGATDASWSSQRVDLGSWQLRIDFEIDGGRGFAIWTFDPRKLVLTPENEAALSLSSTESLHSALIPKLKPVGPTSDKQPAGKQTVATKPASSIQETIAAANLKSNLVARPESDGAGTDKSPTEDPAKKGHLTVVRGEEPLVSSDANPEPEAAQVAEQPQSASEAPTKPASPPVTSDLLSEVRSKRTSESPRDAEHAPESELRQPGATRPLIPVEEPTPVTTSIRVVTEDQLSNGTQIHERPEESQLPAIEPEDEVAAEVDLDSDDSQQSTESRRSADEPKPETKKGRPGIPSWDEIVFGTKTDD